MIVFANITIVGFIWVFSYATKAAATSELIILVRFGNNINLKIPKASILPFSSINLESFFLVLNTSSIISTLGQ